MPVVSSNSPLLEEQSVTHSKNARHFCLPKATDVDFFGPYSIIEAIAPVLVKDELVGMMHNGPESVIHQKAGKAKPKSKAYQGNDSDPLLLRVFLCFPWLLQGTFLDSPRTEVVLTLFLVLEVDG